MPACRIEKLASLVLLASLSLAPLYGAIVPRALGFLPALIGLTVFLLLYWEKKVWPQLDKTLGVICLAVFVLSTSSALWSKDLTAVLSASMKSALIIFGGVLLFSTVATLKTKLDLLKYLPLCLAGGCVYIIIEYYLGFPIYRAFHDVTALRPRDIASINRPSVILSVLVWPAVSAMPEKLKEWRMALPALTLAMLLLTGSSQSALFGLLAGGCTWIVALRWPKIMLHSMAICLTIGLWLAPWIAKFLYSWQPDFLVQWRIAASGARIDIWNAVAENIFNHPFHGYGLESSRLLDKLDTGKFFKGKMILHPHNNALQLWVEFGMLGAALGTAVIGMIAIHLQKIEGIRQKVGLAVFATLSAISLVGYGLWQSWWLGLIILSLSCCAAVPDRK